MSNHGSRCRMIASAAAILVWFMPAELYAADLDSSFFVNQPPPIQTQPVEFGTGWYIRGDLAYGLDSLPNADAYGLFPTAAAFRSTYAIGLGAGYKFTNWFRTDITGDFLQPLTAYDPATNTNAFGGRWDVLANGYLDLGTWGGVTPYVGAGVGAAVGDTRISTMDSTIPCTQGGAILCDMTNMPVSLAWALMAGVSFQVFPHTYIDLGYRYLNLGAYSFYNNAPINGASGLSTTGQSHAHEIRVGLRYMID